MHVLIQKLKALHEISDEEEAAILSALEGPYEVERGEDIAADGSKPKHSTVMLAGVACRYKLLSDGRRQILAFEYPGDVTDGGWCSSMATGRRAGQAGRQPERA